jgi:hypothetical protein
MTRRSDISYIVAVMDRIERRGWNPGFAELAYQRLLLRRQRQIVHRYKAS